MAQMIRQAHELTALSCRLEIHEQRPRVLSQVYRGRVAVGPPIRTDLDALGLSAPLTPGAFGVTEASLRGSDIERQLVAASIDIDVGPIWLQIPRGAAKLAALPWEASLSPVIRRSMLRIPNFLLNPFMPGHTIRIAICASWPAAKGGHELDAPLRRLLNYISLSTDPLLPWRQQTFHIDIFTDDETYDRFADTDLQKLQLGHLSFKFHNPREVTHESVEPSSSERALVAQGSTIKNPWLRWMAKTYQGVGVDVVHFLCPGYFYEDNGALALAQTPTKNFDRQWSRFIGCRELSKFYDRMGCSVMGFSPVGPPEWILGLRMLAYELSWQRAGPIILDAGGDGDALRRAYGSLLRSERFDPTIASDLQFCVHPDALRDADPSDRDAPPSVAFNSTILSLERSGKVPDVDVLSSNEATFNDYLYRPQTSLGGGGRPQELSQQILRAERANLSSIRPKSQLDEARDIGAERALDFIAQLTQTE